MAARDPMASMVGVNRQLLQPGALYSSTHVQEWLSPAGQRRSMPTNCPDDPTVINNNTLRSTRGTGGSRYALTGSNPAAGNHFSACTLVDNWQQRLEFQDPPVGDARGRVLANTASMKQRDAALAAACSARLQANRQATSRWASMYSREFLQQEFVLRVEQQQQQRQ
ncbi:hypothetical protein OEZ85_004526 [Tetradesmus obliquus]|uniref:U-box domain-containing protein n=1 Tax=Tetradesmus obliquus TaxID=3088 RepID=A0ABY8UNG6_TETOB|nr:hypothetical protein OEZ85_004526 [Tetradesmus obliquus]